MLLAARVRAQGKKRTSHAMTRLAGLKAATVMRCVAPAVKPTWQVDVRDANARASHPASQPGRPLAHPGFPACFSLEQIDIKGKPRQAGQSPTDKAKKSCMRWSVPPRCSRRSINDGSGQGGVFPAIEY